MNVVLVLVAVLGLPMATATSAPPTDTAQNLLPSYERLSHALYLDDLIGAKTIARRLELEGSAANEKIVTVHAADLQQRFSI